MIEQVNVSSIPYKITEVEDLTYEKAGDTDAPYPSRKLHGFFDQKKLKILIEKNQAELVKKTTLLHEIFHAMLGQTPYYNEEYCEGICVCLEFLLLRLIKDNPELIKYIQEKEIEPK